MRSCQKKRLHDKWKWDGHTFSFCLGQEIEIFKRERGHCEKLCRTIGINVIILGKVISCVNIICQSNITAHLNITSLKSELYFLDQC